MTSVAREGEYATEHERSGRTFAARNGWRVKTREGHPLGSYPTQFYADVVAALLVAQLAQASNPQTCRRIIYNFRHDDRFRTVNSVSAESSLLDGFPNVAQDQLSA
ncbi:MAG: hypothetical protein FJ194_14995 [Gammaproteobacteria bacterium]|nr:hypothetical protein [Gammaproteobacteria bacterium]